MFSKDLLLWHQTQNQRKMPWKGEKEPYKIWISEIILQQTKVEQGEKYYHNILERYPSIADLAAAEETEMYKIWQGLGYYNRCKNMLHTAKELVQKYDGIFPNTYAEIIQLKGIGSYTAAALLSFAYNLPYAVVDGNVVRVLSRYFGIFTDFYTTKGKKEFELLAGQKLAKKESALYNQAIMDLGASICTPRNPLCGQCPFEKKCFAKQKNLISELPVKKTKLVLKNRYFHFLVFEYQNVLFIQKRTEKDIWHQLYSPYSIEAEHLHLKDYPFIQKAKVEQNAEVFVQKLTHQKIHGYFYKIQISDTKQIAHLNLIKIQKSALKNFAFPRLIISFFEKNNYL